MVHCTPNKSFGLGVTLRKRRIRNAKYIYQRGFGPPPGGPEAHLAAEAAAADEEAANNNKLLLPQQFDALQQRLSAEAANPWLPQIDEDEADGTSQVDVQDLKSQQVDVVGQLSGVEVTLPAELVVDGPADAVTPVF